MPGAASATIPEEEDPGLSSEGGSGGGGSTHDDAKSGTGQGLDQMSGPLDGTREAEWSPSMIDVAAESGLVGELEGGGGEGKGAGEREAEAAPRVSEVGFGGTEGSFGESGGVPTGAGQKDLSPTQTREEEGIAP